MADQTRICKQVRQVRVRHPTHPRRATTWCPGGRLGTTGPGRPAGCAPGRHVVGLRQVDRMPHSPRRGGENGCPSCNWRATTPGASRSTNAAARVSCSSARTAFSGRSDGSGGEDDELGASTWRHRVGVAGAPGHRYREQPGRLASAASAVAAPQPQLWWVEAGTEAVRDPRPRVWGLSRECDGHASRVDSWAWSARRMSRGHRILVDCCLTGSLTSRRLRPFHIRRDQRHHDGKGSLGVSLGPALVVGVELAAPASERRLVQTDDFNETGRV